MTPETHLYGRWRTTRDSEAFREIVERHLGMVYATARRILANSEDAEEVAQECFEQLASEKAVVRENLAGWLYRTAANRALNRVYSEGARKSREKRYVENREASVKPTWHDIYSHVDEALAALPDELRSAIVLRYFEGHTHEEAALALNVSPNTVMSRVKRGVEELRRRMGEKGFVAGATVATALAALKSEAAPVTLTASVNKIALAGWTGAGATTIVSPIAIGAFFMKNTIAGAVVMLTVIAAGIGAYRYEQTASKPTVANVHEIQHAPVVAASNNVSSPQSKPSEPKSAAPSTTHDDALDPTKGRFEGVVVDAHGATLAGYVVSAFRLDSDRGRRGHVETSPTGTFVLNNLDPGRYWVAIVGNKARAQSFPPMGEKSAIRLAAGEVKTGVILHFSEGAGIGGIVVDEKGKPIDDVQVFAQPQGTLGWKDRYPVLAEAVPDVQDDLAQELNMNAAILKTAKDGRFDLLNMLEGSYNVMFTKKGYRVVNRTAELGASDLQVVLEKLQLTVVGQVVDAVTGRPVPNAEVCLYGSWPGNTGAISSKVPFDKKADADGRFTLTDANASRVGFLIARAEGHMADRIDLQFQTVGDDGAIKDVVVALKPSRKARGRVVNDQKNGVANVNIFLGNSPNPIYTEFTENSVGVTNDSGSFEVNIESGDECTISASAREPIGKGRKGHLVGDSVEISEGTGDVEGIILTLSADGGNITGTLSIDGAPVPHVRVIATAMDPKSYFNMYTNYDGETDDSGQYTIRGLPPMRCMVHVDSGICPGFPAAGQYKVSGVSREVTVERQQPVSADLNFILGDAQIVGRLQPLGADPSDPLPFEFQLIKADGTTQKYWTNSTTDGSFQAAGLPAGEVKWGIPYAQGNKLYNWTGTLQVGNGASVTFNPELSESNQTPIIP